MPNSVLLKIELRSMRLPVAVVQKMATPCRVLKTMELPAPEAVPPTVLSWLFEIKTPVLSLPSTLSRVHFPMTN